MSEANHAARLVDLHDLQSRSAIEYHLQMPHDAKMSRYRYQKICLLIQELVLVVVLAVMQLQYDFGLTLMG
jgi:hypothetical protein